MKEATDVPGTWIHSRTDSSEEPQASGQSLANSNVDSWVWTLAQIYDDRDNLELVGTYQFNVSVMPQLMLEERMSCFPSFGHEKTMSAF